MNEILTFVIGTALRLGIPLLVTVVVVYLLGKLDAHWQAEATQQRPDYQLDPNQLPCWEQKGCSPEAVAKCQAYLDQSQPCWQTFRAQDGHMKEACLDCEVFHGAPIPVAHS